MRALSSEGIIIVWERGQGLASVDQALVILTLACPDRSRDELAALSIGRRDALLLDVREQTIGQSLEGFADCPRCSAQLEFKTRVSDLRAEAESDVEQKEFKMRESGFRLRFRLPDSRDLAAVAGCENVEAASSLIARRCVIEAALDGRPVAFEKLTEKILEKLASRMSECDPQSDVNLSLVCSACGNQWHVIFDIASFFMEEINTLARRLLRETHLLARAYGWRESDILAMSARRRAFYLEIVS